MSAVAPNGGATAVAPVSSQRQQQRQLQQLDDSLVRALPLGSRFPTPSTPQQRISDSSIPEGAPAPQGSFQDPSRMQAMAHGGAGTAVGTATRAFTSGGGFTEGRSIPEDGPVPVGDFGAGDVQVRGQGPARPSARRAVGDAGQAPWLGGASAGSVSPAKLLPSRAESGAGSELSLRQPRMRRNSSERTNLSVAQSFATIGTEVAALYRPEQQLSGVSAGSGSAWSPSWLGRRPPSPELPQRPLEPLPTMVPTGAGHGGGSGPNSAPQSPHAWQRARRGSHGSGSPTQASSMPSPRAPPSRARWQMEAAAAMNRARSSAAVRRAAHPVAAHDEQLHEMTAAWADVGRPGGGSPGRGAPPALLLGSGAVSAAFSGGPRSPGGGSAGGLSSPRSRAAEMHYARTSSAVVRRESAAQRRDSALTRRLRRA
eukprot:143561-Chlamydomonas_euryale.AAC.3